MAKDNLENGNGYVYHGDLDKNLIDTSNDFEIIDNEVINNIDAYDEQIRQQNTKMKNTYSMPRFNPDEVPQTKFARKAKLSSVRQTIKNFFGISRYSGYDRNVDVNLEKRKDVPIHHSLGRQLALKGHNVLEIDCAGSTFDAWRNEHKGLKGKHNKLDDRFVQKYGFDAKSGKRSTGTVLKKEKELTNGKKIQRFTVPGPKILELLDLGRTMSTITDHVYNISTEYIKDITESKDWRDNRTPISLNLQGHSRGAVGEALGVKKTMEWIQKNYPKTADFKDYSQFIKVNAIQMDPVAGGDSYRDKWNKIDYRDKNGKKIPGLNTTTIYTIHSEHGTGFAPSEVRGQDRIILVADKHGVGLDTVDTSQKNVEGDNALHKAAMFDSKTGEAYRGSGISELPRGVFFRDENGVLVRMRSYSEAVKITNEVLKNASGQKDRKKIVLKSVKNWFIDNAYIDETMTDEEKTAEAERVRNVHNAESPYSVLFDEHTSDSGEMDKVKKALRKVEGLRNEDPDNKLALISAYSGAIEELKKYMSVKNPSSEKGIKRMNAVADFLSLYRIESDILDKSMDNDNSGDDF